MSQVTKILNAIAHGDTDATNQLLPLVYHELRRLAAQRLAHEKQGASLQPTVLVHEAYLRLVDVDDCHEWNGRAHFFAAAAEAMRRIMIENARRKKAQKRGGDHQRIGLEFVPPQDMSKYDDLLALDEVLRQFEDAWPVKAQLVKLRYFAGFSYSEAADVLGISVATAERYWAFSRAWLRSRLTT